jgi:hypothetical protein
MSEPPTLDSLLGCVITRIALDDRVTLNIVGQGERAAQVSAVLLIYTDFSVTSPGAFVQVRPVTHEGYASTTALLDTRIDSVSVQADGSLTLNLSGDLKIHVASSDNSDSWEVFGKGVEAWPARAR